MRIRAAVFGVTVLVGSVVLGFAVFVVGSAAVQELSTDEPAVTAPPPPPESAAVIEARELTNDIFADAVADLRRRNIDEIGIPNWFESLDDQYLTLAEEEAARASEERFWLRYSAPSDPSEGAPWVAISIALTVVLLGGQIVSSRRRRGVDDGGSEP